ncbi:MAG: DNA repair protein RecO [Acidobacteriota bacterium]
MRLLSAEALVLDVVDLQERDRIATFLTREYGKKRGVAQGARRKYSRFAGQLQPLAKVQLEWFEKDNRDLARLRDVSLIRPAHKLQADLEGNLLGSYLADHMLEFAQEGESSENLYRLLDTSIESLLSGADRDLVARYFEVWVLRLQGIFPAPRDCPICGRAFSGLGDRGRPGALLPNDGDALICLDCAGGEGARGSTVGTEVLEFLRRTGREGIAQLAETATREGTLREVEGLTAKLRRRFLGHELRSYDVIRQAQRTAGPA